MKKFMKGPKKHVIGAEELFSESMNKYEGREQDRAITWKSCKMIYSIFKSHQNSRHKYNLSQYISVNTNVPIKYSNSLYRCKLMN